MENVKINKMQYEMIKNHKENFEDFLYKITEFKEYTRFEEMSESDAIKAFFRHEVVLTTEERVIDAFEVHSEGAWNVYDDAWKNGARYIMREYGIEIEGVNK